MPRTIIQTVTFKNTSPEILYGIYMDSKKHSDATGGEAKITSKEGASYSAWDGYITGKNFQLMKNKIIVQSWRSGDFKTTDLDSTLILQFYKKGKDAILLMVHANVPAQAYPGIKKGWDDFYWKPWKIYLSKNKITT